MRTDKVSVGLFSLQYSVFDVTSFSEKEGLHSVFLMTEIRKWNAVFKWNLGINIDVSADIYTSGTS